MQFSVEVLLFCRSTTTEESWDTVEEKKETFHKYPLPNNTIHLLSTASDFEWFLASGLTASKQNKF